MGKIKSEIVGVFRLSMYIVIIMIAAALLLTGCKTTYVPVESVRTEYKSVSDTIRDSIYHEVFMDRYIQGDTVYLTMREYIYKDRWRSRSDTVLKCDTVRVPYAVTETKKVIDWHYTILIAILIWILWLFIYFYLSGLLSKIREVYWHG